MSEWKTIENAPKDGTEIIVMQWDHQTKTITGIDIGWWDFIEYSDYDNSPIYDWCSNNGDIDEPTHWMHLPRQPQE